MKKTQRIIITHGYTANSQKHWFNWLKARLENHGFFVYVLDMPNSNHPNAAQWLAYHQTQIGKIQSNDIFIGHSLGCIANLRFLTQALSEQAQSPAGLFLVAGFDQALPNLPELDEFTQSSLDYSLLIERIPVRMVFASADDDVVAPYFSQQLSESLQAKFVLTNGYGHFTERNNITRLPLLYDEVINIAN